MKNAVDTNCSRCLLQCCVRMNDSVCAQSCGGNESNDSVCSLLFQSIFTHIIGAHGGQVSSAHSIGGPRLYLI